MFVPHTFTSSGYDVGTVVANVTGQLTAWLAAHQAAVISHTNLALGVDSVHGRVMACLFLLADV